MRSFCVSLWFFAISDFGDNIFKILYLANQTHLMTRIMPFIMKKSNKYLVLRSILCNFAKSIWIVLS